MTSDVKQRVEIKDSAITICAILLLAVYFITDFLVDKQAAVAVIYAMLLSLGIYLCSKKTCFYEAIYPFILLVVLGNILRYSFPYLKNPGGMVSRLLSQFTISPESYGREVLSTPYLYFYLVGMVLLIIGRLAPNLCQSHVLKNLFRILGMHSVWAFLLHLCAPCFTERQGIENVIFCIFAISAFWNAYTQGGFRQEMIEGPIWLVVAIAIFILLYPEQYGSFLEGLRNLQKMPWFYSLGLFIICLLCIGSDKVIQDILLGFILLGTNILVFYGMRIQTQLEPGLLVFFHILALSFFYLVKQIFAPAKKDQGKGQFKGLLAACYGIAFLFLAFLMNHLIPSIAMLCIGLLFLLVYFGKRDLVKGRIYGTVLYGAIPWMMLETTLHSLGKLEISLFPALLFTIFFWCLCGLVLSWKDTARIKAIAFEKAGSEGIVNVLSGAAYLLTAVVLFL